MLIDCDTCTARPFRCEDCVVTVLLGSAPADPAGRWDLDCEEEVALVRLADGGLLPPLRLA